MTKFIRIGLNRDQEIVDVVGPFHSCPEIENFVVKNSVVLRVSDEIDDNDYIPLPTEKDDG